MTDTSPAQGPYSEGVAFLEMRDHLSEAEAAFRLGLAADPNHAGCLLQLGVALRVQGRLKEAAYNLGRARDITPKDPVVHMQLGRVFRLQKKMKAALNAYDDALAIDPSHVGSLIHRAITQDEMHDWGEALNSYDRLMAELPRQIVVAYDLPRLRAEVSKRLARIESYGVEVSLSSQEMAVALYRRGNQSVLEGEVDTALSLYEEAALLLPDYSDPAFPIGDTVAVQLARRPSGEYLSCRWIEECLHFHENRLAFCCTSHSIDKGWATVGTYYGGPVPIDYVLARRNKLTEENQAGVDNACRGCPELERRSWQAKPWVFTILILNSHSTCNQKCSYCFLAINNFEMPSYYYLAESAIDNLIAKGWLAPDVYVLWGGGEPTVSKEFPVISTKLFARGCHFNIYTNVTRVVPVLVDALRQGRCDLVTSVDSGTPETFYRIKYKSDHPVMIKGSPAFETVWANIASYTEASSNTVFVKYIFTLQNCGDSDIAGFIDLCLAHGVKRVTLVPEFSDTFSGEVPDLIWDAICKTRVLAQANGLIVHFNPLYFKAGNMPAELIHSLLGPDQNHDSSDPSLVTSSGKSNPDKYLNLLHISTSLPSQELIGNAYISNNLL